MAPDCLHRLEEGVPCDQDEGHIQGRGANISFPPQRVCHTLIAYGLFAPADDAPSVRARDMLIASGMPDTGGESV